MAKYILNASGERLIVDETTGVTRVDRRSRSNNNGIRHIDIGTTSSNLYRDNSRNIESTAEGSGDTGDMSGNNPERNNGQLRSGATGVCTRGKRTRWGRKIFWIVVTLYIFLFLKDCYLELEDFVLSNSSGNRKIMSEDESEHKSYDFSGDDSCEINQTTSLIPEGAYKYNGHSYYIYTGQPDYETAIKFCEKLKGHIVTIETEEENKGIYKMIKKWSKKTGRKEVYLGLVSKKSKWKWGDKTKIHYTNWVNGISPKGKVAKMSIGDKGKWSAGNFENSRTCYFVCEWDAS